MCAGGMGVGLLLVLLLLAVIGYIAYRLGQSQSNGEGTGRNPGRRSERGDEALEMARIRYAKGEISREEFEQIRRDLA